MTTKTRRVPAEADTIGIRACRCGCDLALVELYDARGTIFATAWLTKMQMLGLADTMVDLVGTRPTQRRLAS